MEQERVRGGHSPLKGPKEALSGPGRGQPAPDSGQMTRPVGMGPQAPQIATRFSSLGVRRPSGAGHKPPRRLRGRILERLHAIWGEKRARRSLMSDFSTPDSEKHAFTSQLGVKTEQTTRMRFPCRTVPVVGGLCPALDGRRTPSRAERVAIWGVHGPTGTAWSSHRCLVQVDPAWVRKGLPLGPSEDCGLPLAPSCSTSVVPGNGVRMERGCRAASLTGLVGIRTPRPSFGGFPAVLWHSGAGRSVKGGRRPSRSDATTKEERP
ncbi:hypothetical protein EDD91_6493 [Streptomyces sp. KS 21]|nr:hypothetical protein EDD91_6493 [Streptomyces sp. KS 21]